MAITFNAQYYGYPYVGRTTGGGITTVAPTISTTDLFANAPTLSDAVYFVCFGGPFTGLRFANTGFVKIASTSHTITWEYFDGALWQPLSGISDGTLGFTVAGDVTWTLPSPWPFYDYVYTTQHWRLWWVRARLSAANNITEGGAINPVSYVQTRPYTMYISGTENITPGTLYASSVAGGWGTVIWDGDKKITFRDGFIFDSANITFTCNGYSLQFGTYDKPTFHFGYLSGYQSAKWVVNADAIYKTSQWGSSFEFYTSNLPISYYIYSTASGAEFNNVMFSLYYNNATPTFGQLYRLPYFGATAVGNQNYNLTFNGYVLPYGSGNYERCNMASLQYILTAPDATYKSMYFKSAGAGPVIDPNNLPVVEDSIFDGQVSPTTWNQVWCGGGGGYNFHGFLEVIDCYWPGNNKEVPPGYMSIAGDMHLRVLYSHRIDIKVTDLLGTPISGASISLTDAYGNPALNTVVPAVYPSTLYTDIQTTINVTASAPFTTGKYYMIFGEAMLCNTKPTGTTITVTRGCLNTRGRYVNNPYASSKFYEMQNSLLTNVTGDIVQCKIAEIGMYRNGQPATYVMYRYTPHIIRVEKAGYKTYTMSVTMNSAPASKFIIRMEPNSVSGSGGQIVT